MRRFGTGFISILVIFSCVFVVTMTQAGNDKNPTQENTQVTTEGVSEETVVEEVVEEVVEIEVLPPVVDEIALKQEEMRNTTILVQTFQGSGSGTIIDCLETDAEGVFEYRVLSNAHVTYSRFITIVRGVDSLTGKVQRETTDTGCGIVVFDHANKDYFQYGATVIDEDVRYDLSLLSFRTDKKLPVARVADKDQLNQVRVFDEIFAIGCQLGRGPSPTTGIVSQIITGNNGEKEWAIYGNTAQITPGSSGGGLFKKYDDHYYLIGIPFRVAVAGNGQFVPHLAHAISIEVARDFIDQNVASCP